MRYTYAQAVHGALVFAHQACLFVLYTTLFTHVAWLGSAPLLVVAGAATACMLPLDADWLRPTCLLWTWALTPVLRTLTTTISTDTLYAMVALSAVVHLAASDYGVRAPM